MNRNGAGPQRPWEREDGEPDRAWAAFVAYRDLAPGERSLNRSRTGGGPVLSELKRWSGRWRWVERVRAWDAHVDALRRAGAEEVEVERGRTGVELAGRVRGVLAAILDRPDLDSGDVLRAARALRELALVVPEPVAPAPRFDGTRSGMRPAATDDGGLVVDGRRIWPPPTEEEDRQTAVGVLAVLEEAGVIALPEWSDEPGRVGGGNGHLPHDDDAY